MEMNRNQQHFIIMTVIYDELNDYFIGGGKSFRDARELTSELLKKLILIFRILSLKH